VADIGRKGTTWLPGGSGRPQEVLDAAAAGATRGGAKLPLEELVVAGQVEPSGRDGVDDAVGIGHLRPDHLGPVVELEPGVYLVGREIDDEQDDRPA
jgi:hypothetical protein